MKLKSKDSSFLKIDRRKFFSIKSVLLLKVFFWRLFVYNKRFQKANRAKYRICRIKIFPNSKFKNVWFSYYSIKDIFQKKNLLSRKLFIITEIFGVHLFGNILKITEIREIFILNIPFQAWLNSRFLQVKIKMVPNLWWK